MTTAAIRAMRVVVLTSVFSLVWACDRDPAEPTIIPLDPQSVTAPIIARQGSIEVDFGTPVQSASALDPENFVVINQCNGLRVPGSLRLNETRDRVTFTPSTPLPFLTLLSIRVQNTLSDQGRSLAQPLTFTVRTEDPPVRDVSWELLNSPTSDNVSGVSFVDRNRGYAVTIGGEVYRTLNGGRVFSPRFKDVGLSVLFNIRAFGTDTAYMLGSFKVGGLSRFSLFRTIDGAASFEKIGPDLQTFLLNLSMERDLAGNPQGVFGGSFATAEAYRFRFETGTVTRATVPIGPSSFSGIALSKNTTRAALTARPFSGISALAFRSTDGGLNYTQVALPAGTRNLFGVAFIDDRDALLLGDSSTIIRLNAETGATSSPLGASAGIPQSFTDPTTNTTTIFTFSRGSFVKGSPVGWITGSVRRRRPGEPDVVNGIILMTRDGGATFTQQAIRGTPDNGQGFPPVIDVFALATDFAALSGAEGLIAARTADIQTGAAVCSLTNP